MLTIQCDTHVAKSLQWLRGKGELCDMVVVGGDGQQTWGHSCVLAAHSTVIASVLQGRLAAMRDWSVVRPLVISIDDVAVKDQDGGCKVNVVEALVGLVYGETVSVTPPHLPTLIKYATLLGLSHHICSSLELNRTQGEVAQTPKHNVNTIRGRRKQSRKPILGKLTEKKDACEVRQGITRDDCETKQTEGRDVSEARQAERKDVCEVKQTEENISEVRQAFTGDTCEAKVAETRNMCEARQADQVTEVSLDVVPDQSYKSEDYVLPHTLTGKVDCEASILELSMLCEEVKDTDNSGNTRWPLDQCQEKTLTFEQPIITDPLQPSGPSTSLDSTGILSTVRELSEESIGVKMETACQSESRDSLNNQSVGQDFMDLVSLDEQGGFCGETQQQQQQQKQQKQRALGKGLVCGGCGAAFQRCGDLVKHLQLSQHFTTQCPLCFVQVREVEGQRLHFALHDQELPFFCLYCDLRFRTRAALTMHAPKHSTTRPFVCSDCGRGFKWRHALQAHSLTHSPSTRLLCDVCGFSSKYVSSFKAHLVQHSGGSFPCPHPGCTFTSPRKTHLNDHLATHNKTRVHQCEVCGHSFSHAKNMRRHMRLHAPASNLLSCTPLSKIQCNFRTTRPDKLRDHLAKKHNLSQPQPQISQDSITKLLLGPTSQYISSDPDFVQKTTLEALSGLEGFKTSEVSTDFASIVQEVTTPDLSNLEKLNFKANGNESIMSIKVENGPGFPNSEPVVGSQLTVHTSVSSDHQESFSVLVNSQSIAELTDIPALDTHDNQTAKQQCVEEMADDFPPGFLVEHDILMDKPEDASQMSQSQQLESDTSMADLITQAENSLPGQGEFSAHMDPPPYPGFPSQGTSGDVVLEVMAAPPPQSSITPSPSQQNAALHTEKQEQCMESLNILEFMLDSVSD